MKNWKQNMKYGVGAVLASLTSAAVMAGTYMPDVTTEITAVATEAKTMGTDTFGAIFPVIAFFVGIAICIKVFRKYANKIG